MHVAIGGNPGPDCRIADAGPPAGQVDGHDYWQWVAAGKTWRLSTPEGVGTYLVHSHPFDWSQWWWAHPTEFPYGPLGDYPSASGSVPCWGTVIVTEVPADNTPDTFAFLAVTDADPSTVYVSDEQTITGMDAGTSVSITGGEYRLDGGAWTAEAGTIDPGQTLELRATSSAESEGVVTVTITVGTLSVDWTITTAVLGSVVTTILWGSTPDTSRILSSRIVRGMV